MIKSVFDTKRNEFNVTITKQELDEAFKSEQHLQRCLHNIVVATHGKDLADELFPIQEGDETE